MKKLSEIKSLEDKPDWNDRLVEYTSSLSAPQLEKHVKDIDKELKDGKPNLILKVARGGFIHALRNIFNR